MRNGQWEEAASAFGAAARLAPTSAKAYFNLGLARFQQGRLDDALLALHRSLTLSPQLRGAHLFAGIVQYRKDRYADAIASLKRETQIDSSNSKAFMWLGVAQLAAGDAAAASVALDKAAELSPEDVDILYHRGRAHMLVSKESYEQMYKADPDSWRIHQALAQSFVQADRLEDAINECQVALRSRPNEPGLHEELADIYWKQNQLDKAELAFQDELKIDSNSLSSMLQTGGCEPGACQARSYRFFAWRSIAPCSTVYGHALPDGPGAGAIAADLRLREAHYYLGLTYARLGRTEDSARELQTASQLESEEVEKHRTVFKIIDTEEGQTRDADHRY